MSTHYLLSIVALLVVLAWLVLRSASWRRGDGGGTEDGGSGYHGRDVGDGCDGGGDGGGGD